jgi:hypothetical protein
MNDAVFCDIKTQFVLHMKHVTFPLQSTAGYFYVRFEVVTAVTMKNDAFWDIKTQFIPHRIHIASTLQSTTGEFYVRFEVFTAVTRKNAVFWCVAPCGSCNNRSLSSQRSSIASYR